MSRARISRSSTVGRAAITGGCLLSPRTLVNKSVHVVATVGGEPSALAAKAATSTIPIVFAMGSDPVQAGLVESYNRPGGSITGIDIVTDTIDAKRIGLLHDLVP